MSAEVENLISAGANLAFILESPHVAEVAHGYPACGASGQEMSRFLLGRHDVPLGLIVHRPEILRILGIPKPHAFSIVNVSKRPLKKAAYVENGGEVPADINERMALKRLIEKGADFSTEHRDLRLCTLRDSLYAEFEKNSESWSTQCRVVIPCGRFAELFVCRLQQQRLDLRFHVVEDIPHPSRGWSRLTETAKRSLLTYFGFR